MLAGGVVVPTFWDSILKVENIWKRIGFIHAKHWMYSVEQPKLHNVMVDTLENESVVLWSLS